MVNLDNEILKYDIKNMEYQYFLNIIIGILNKHAHIKQKYFEQIKGDL